MKKILFFVFCLGVFNPIQAQELDTSVEISGHQLHFHIIQGKGIPILFESGNGSDSTVWKDILKPLQESTGTTLITYDRAGLGSSGVNPSRMNLLSEVKDLEIALEKLGYSKNIFLVNHSFGSNYSTLFTLRNTDKVMGTVFIEPALPCYFTKERMQEVKEKNKMIAPELWERIKKEALGLYYVLINNEDITDLTNNQTYPSSIPSTIIAAENQPFLKKDKERTDWKECLKYFGELPNHHYIFVNGSGHSVWKDNPDLVINEITQLYKRSTNNGSEK